MTISPEDVDQPEEPVMAYLSLGSNLGDRKAHLDRALRMIGEGGDAILSDMHCSSIYEVPALLPEGAPASWDIPFLNMVVGGVAIAAPDMMLKRIEEIERMLERQREGRWSPRTIDVDILCYGDHVVQADDLTIPHPEMHRREFVMLPLAELAPGWVFPVGVVKAGETVANVLSQLDTENMQPWSE